MRNYMVVLLMFVAFKATAQTEKGSFMIGGSMRIQRSAVDYTYSTGPSTSTTNTSRSGNFSLSPTIGYFFAKNLMIGLQPDFDYSWALGAPYTTSAFSLGPVVRYYFPMGKFAIFPEVGYVYGWEKSKSEVFNYTGLIETQTTKRKRSNARAGIGAAWFVAPHVGIEGILTYQNIDLKGKDSGDQRLFYFNVGIQFYIPAKQ